MPNYRRWRQPGATYFFTVNLRDRRQRYLVEHIVALRASIAAVQTKWPFQIDAAVVLPDHLHMIWTLPEGESDFPLRWRLIKSRFSAAVNPPLPHQDRLLRKKERGLWQRGYLEHLIRDERDYEDHVNYVHYNPVKHGYVERPADWPYSSLHRFVQEGVLDEHWGACGPVCDLDLD